MGVEAQTSRLHPQHLDYLPQVNRLIEIETPYTKVYSPISWKLQTEKGSHEPFIRHACVKVGETQAWFEISTAEKMLPSQNEAKIQFSLAHALDLTIGHYNQQTQIFFNHIDNPDPHQVMIRPFGPHENAIHDGTPSITDSYDMSVAAKQLMHDIYPDTATIIPTREEFEDFLMQHEFSSVFTAANGVSLGKERIVTTIDRYGDTVDRYIRLAQVPTSSDESLEKPHTFVYLVTNVPTEALPGHTITLADVDMRADTYCDCQKYGKRQQSHSCGHELLLTIERADSEARPVIIASGIGDDFRGHGVLGHMLKTYEQANLVADDIRDAKSLGLALAAVSELTNVSRARIIGANTQKIDAIQEAMTQVNPQFSPTILGDTWMEKYFPEPVTLEKHKKNGFHNGKYVRHEDNYTFPENETTNITRKEAMHPSKGHLILANYLLQLTYTKNISEDLLYDPVPLGNNSHILLAKHHGKIGFYPVDVMDNEVIFGEAITDHQQLASFLQEEKINLAQGDTIFATMRQAGYTITQQDQFLDLFIEDEKRIELYTEHQVPLTVLSVARQNTRRPMRLFL